MRILLTFCGYHDPFAVNGVEGDMVAGPVLTVAAERPFDHVYLFSTPNLAEICEQTRVAIQERHPDTEVTILDVPLKDPTNYIGILRQIRSHFREIQKAYPDASYAISVSSGTPQMHSCWLLLAASGEIPAKILQSRPAAFVAAGGSQVREVDIHKQGFPQITASSSSTPDDANADLVDLCSELGIIGDDPSFTKVLEEALVYASYDDIHLLLLGETGSGKEYLANFIHRAGPRASRPLIVVNCSSIPKDLVESQLFGHKKGAFTGASVDHPGKFMSANGGVLFLDELGELPLETQAKLLRALDQGEIEPLGSSKPVKVNVRVVAATNRNIREMVAAGTFREDLYQRFGATLGIPPLRERRMDIPKLALHILANWNAKHKKERSLSAAALTELTRYSWPGNVRELHKVVLQSAMLTANATIGPKDLRFEITLSTESATSLPEPSGDFRLNDYLETVKSRLVERAMTLSDGKQAAAARLLGLSPQAINQYFKRHGDQ